MRMRKGVFQGRLNILLRGYQREKVILMLLIGKMLI